MMDWNDLRYFLAVADQGSTLAAGEVARLLETDLELNVQGLLIWLARLRKDSAVPGVKS